MQRAKFELIIYYPIFTACSSRISGTEGISAHKTCAVD